MNKIINKIIFCLFAISASNSMEVPLTSLSERTEAITSPWVLLGEIPISATKWGIYDISLNYSGETTHHQARGYCTVSLAETFESDNKVLSPDIKGNITKPFIWEEISKFKRSLIADMTFVPPVTENRMVIEYGLKSLISGGVYLIPVRIGFKNGQYFIGTTIGDNLDSGEFTQQENIHFSQMLTNFGIPVKEYTGGFPDPSIFELASEKIDVLVKKSYPSSNILKAELKASPLIRAFWNLPQKTRDSLVVSIEHEELFSRTVKIYLNIIHDKKPNEEIIDQMKKSLRKHIESDPLQKLLWCINLNLDKNPYINKKSFIEIAKKQAEEEERLYGPYFGPNGTTFNYSFETAIPSCDLPPYIIITKK